MANVRSIQMFGSFCYILEWCLCDTSYLWLWYDIERERERKESHEQFYHTDVKITG